MEHKELVYLLDEELGLSNFDNKKADELFNKISLFKINLLQKNNDFLLFISSNLTGVYNAVFSQLDSERFFSIFNVSEKKLQLKINALPDIKPEWKVSSNPLYLLCLYLMYKFHQIKYKKENEAFILLFEILSYKMLTSIIYNYYRNKLSIDEAKAVFEKFTYKFLVKKLGSWDAVIKYKAGLILKDGTYYKLLINLNTVNAMSISNAIKTSYNSLINYIAGLTHNGEKSKIISSTIMEDTSEGKNIKEITNTSEYINYLNSIINFENDFVNMGLIKLIALKVKNVEIDNIKFTLQYISKNFNNEKYITDIIENSFEYLISKNEIKFNGNLEYVTLLKGFWASGNPKLKDTKNLLKEYTYKATGRKTDWILNSTSIAVICYIFTRAITKNKI